MRPRWFEHIDLSIGSALVDRVEEQVYRIGGLADVFRPSRKCEVDGAFGSQLVDGVKHVGEDLRGDFG